MTTGQVHNLSGLQIAQVSTKAADGVPPAQPDGACRDSNTGGKILVKLGQAMPLAWTAAARPSTPGTDFVATPRRHSMPRSLAFFAVTVFLISPAHADWVETFPSGTTSNTWQFGLQPSGADGTYGYFSGGATMQSLALYATHTLEISDKLILNDGLRFSAIGLNAKFTDTTFFNFPFKEANQQNNALTGNIGLIYMPSEDSRITAVISSGFRAPNVDDLSKVFESTPENLVVPNDDLKPEYTYNGEVGISQRFGGWLNAQATGYYTLYRNALSVGDFTYQGQDSVFYNGTMSKVVATQNNDNAYLYGLELALNGKMNNHLTMYATYNYTYARIVTDSVAIPLDHIPPAFGKFGIQISEKKFRGDLFVNYSAWKRIEDYRLGAEDNEAYALPEGMPSWYTVNARVTYQFNKIVSLQVACENILDRNYRVFASNISAPGRNFILTLRGNF